MFFSDHNAIEGGSNIDEFFMKYDSYPQFKHLRVLLIQLLAP